MHAAGWAHADVQPTNILIMGDGHAVVVDPGLRPRSCHHLVQFADFDGAPHADWIVSGPGGSASVWLRSAGDQAGADGWTGIGKVAGGT
ncbi:hypothetical protein ACWEP8_24760 [Streptomyces hydrogenans]